MLRQLVFAVWGCTKMPDKKPRIGVDLSLLKPAGITCVDFTNYDLIRQKLGNEYSQNGLTFISSSGDLEVIEVYAPVKPVSHLMLSASPYLEIRLPAAAIWVEVSATSVGVIGKKWPYPYGLILWAVSSANEQSDAVYQPSHDPAGLVRSYAFRSSEPLSASGQVTKELGPITRVTIQGAPGLLLYEVRYR